MFDHPAHCRQHTVCACLSFDGIIRSHEPRPRDAAERGALTGDVGRQEDSGEDAAVTQAKELEGGWAVGHTDSHS